MAKNPEALLKKKCSDCKKIKRLSNFYRAKTGKHGRTAHCKQCHAIRYPYNTTKARERKRVYKANNPDKVRNSDHKAKYGITYDERLELVAACGGVCVCDKPVTDLDHCHRTKEVRGMLCHNCNVALGLVNESPEILRALALYIERFSK